MRRESNRRRDSPLDPLESASSRSGGAKVLHVGRQVRVRIRRRRRDVAAALGGVAVLVACALVVRHGTTGSLEQRVFRAVNGLPDGLSPVMRRAQLLGVLVIGPI